MPILFLILIIIACVVLSLVVLVQNPKGGGLAGNIAGFSTQFMGVKQTTDFLEKFTWIFAAIIGILCTISTVFISNATQEDTPLDNIGNGVPVQQPNRNQGAVPFSSGQQPTPATDSGR
jgi:preprotein translocase subunit SecG